MAQRCSQLLTSLREKKIHLKVIFGGVRSGWSECCAGLFCCRRRRRRRHRCHWLWMRLVVVMMMIIVETGQLKVVYLAVCLPRRRKCFGGTRLPELTGPLSCENQRVRGSLIVLAVGNNHTQVRYFIINAILEKRNRTNSLANSFFHTHRSPCFRYWLIFSSGQACCSFDNWSRGIQGNSHHR